MKIKIRKFDDGHGILLPRRVIERLGLAEGDVLNPTETPAGIELLALEGNFSRQVEAFRRTEPRHRNTYRELVK